MGKEIIVNVESNLNFTQYNRNETTSLGREQIAILRRWLIEKNDDSCYRIFIFADQPSWVWKEKP